MAESKRTNSDVADKEYDRALSLMQYHIGLLWEEFGAFLLTETVLIGFLGTALAQKEPMIGKNWVVFGGAILGLILCFPWWSTHWHNYRYYQLRIEQAKRHEAKLGISLLTEGEKLSSGSAVIINGKKLRHPWLARLLPPRRAFSLLIILFGAAFSILIVITGPWYK
jgi:hypothetical protein